MRLNFGRDVPLDEQLRRMGLAKQPGRKHQHRRGSRANERRKAASERAKQAEKAKSARFHAKVAAYWRGEIETYPEDTR